MYNFLLRHWSPDFGVLSFINKCFMQVSIYIIMFGDICKHVGVSGNSIYSTLKMFLCPKIYSSQIMIGAWYNGVQGFLGITRKVF